MSRRTPIYLSVAVVMGVMFALITLLPFSPTSQAQTDPTSQRQTLDAIVNPRRTLTARSVFARTATALSRLIENNQATLTAAAASGTPLMPTATLDLTIDATDLYQTLIANVNERLTQTAFIQSTLDFQKTVDSIIAQTLGFTPTYTPTVLITPTLTPTLSEVDSQTTLQAIIDSILIQTLQAATAQSATAIIQGTINAIGNRDLTATSAAARATIAAKLEPLNLINLLQIQPLQVLLGHGAPIVSVSVAPLGDFIASTSLDNTVRLWDTLNGIPIATLTGLTDRLGLAISPDGAWIAASSSDSTIRLWSSITQREIRVLRGHTGAVYSIGFSPDSRMLISGGADGTVRIWDIRSGASLLVLNGTSKDNPSLPRATAVPLPAVTSVTFSPDGSRVAAARVDGLIILWETVSGVELGTIQDDQSLRALVFSPDGNLLASAGNGAVIKVWNLSARILQSTLTGHQAEIVTLAFSQDGSFLASGGNDTLIILWNPYTGERLNTIVGHTAAVNSVNFSPDGARLISGGSDLTVRIWGIPKAG